MLPDRVQGTGVAYASTQQFSMAGHGAVWYVHDLFPWLRSRLSSAPAVRNNGMCFCCLSCAFLFRSLVFACRILAFDIRAFINGRYPLRDERRRGSGWACWQFEYVHVYAFACSWNNDLFPKRWRHTLKLFGMFSRQAGNDDSRRWNLISAISSIDI